MQLSPNQRAALNSAVICRAYMARTGFTYAGHRIWTADEDETVRHLYPGLEAMREALPWRTARAIQNRTQHLRLVKAKRIWSEAEYRTMKPPYVEGEPVPAILPRLNDKTARQVWAKASARRIRRPRKPPKPTGLPLVDAIRRRAFDMRLTMRDLDEFTGGGRYFQSPRSIRDYRIKAALRLLGGRLILRWDV